MSEHGAAFDRAQRAYGAMTPESFRGQTFVECPECGGDMEVSRGRKGRYYWSEEKCTCCGHYESSDNFDSYGED